MGMFKEDAYQFEKLMQNQPDYGYITDNSNHVKSIDQIRNWMVDMSDLRYTITYFDKFGKETRDTKNSQKRRDLYFIAWEQDEGMVMGTEYMVITSKQSNGEKTITLNARAARYTLHEFKMTEKRLRKAVSGGVL